MVVKVYALTTCPYCRMARRFLDESSVAYDVVEVDVLEGDEKKAVVEEVRSLTGGASFPVVLIGDEMIIGFNKSRMQELLNL